MDYSCYADPNFSPSRLSLFRVRHDSRKVRKVRAHSNASSSTATTTNPPTSPSQSLTSSSRSLISSSPSKASALPRQPLDYNEEYYKFLEKAVQELKNDYVSGAREMAGKALGFLGTVIELAAITARDRGELWGMAVDGARELGRARPAMRYVVLFSFSCDFGDVLLLLEENPGEGMLGIWIEANEIGTVLQ
jgi:hypothetical protein